jgi:hypothetical protein
VRVHDFQRGQLARTNAPNQIVGRQKTDIVGFHSGFDAGRLRKKTLMVTESRQLQGNVKNQNRTLTAEDAEEITSPPALSSKLEREPKSYTIMHQRVSITLSTRL